MIGKCKFNSSFNKNRHDELAEINLKEKKIYDLLSYSTMQKFGTLETCTK